MHGDITVYSLPRWRVTRWLGDVGLGVPEDIRAQLIGGLFGSLPVFSAGVVNTLIVSAAVAAYMQTAPFVAWFLADLVICFARLIVLVKARRAALARRRTPTDLYLVLSVAWSCSVGYGALVCLMSGDWTTATLACLSGAAMVGGICFRNFGAPNLAAVMILTSIGPCLAGAALSREPLLYVVVVQAPMYLLAMSAAAFKLNKMLVATMLAERENDRRARHDALTGLTNRSGLSDAVATCLTPARLRGDALALLFLDLDGFKTVNDTYGHATGDMLLKMVADRLTHRLRPGDVAARVGGDEFVVLAEGQTQERAGALAAELIAAVARPYDFGDGISANIGVSVGIAMAPEHGASVEDLMAVADAALYEAKSNGKSCWCMGTVLSNLEALKRLRDRATAGEKVLAA